MTKNYGLIGAAGYIAPRHLRAIRDTGGNLSVAYDINDSVGVIDSYFPAASFFTEFEQFSAHVLKFNDVGKGLDYTAICSPNYLHKSHVTFTLRAGSDAICEKPLVLDPEDIDELVSLEVQTGKKVFSILQLRLHPSILALREKVSAGEPNKVYDVDLAYFTSRGSWYHTAWKGIDPKSGGIATNIGVHFFDMLGFVFGPLRKSVVHHRSSDSAAGYLEFRQARVRWMMSINFAHLPKQTPAGQSTYRSITVEGEEIEFSSGFTDLHTKSYEQILGGQGFGLDDARASIELVSSIRNATIQDFNGEQHPELTSVLKG
jgi:UDP-N-acetyl-2-amino-2-deoxyglucuronate dehydrogenase